MSNKNYTTDMKLCQPHIYLLGEKNSGLKPRGSIQDYEKLKRHCLQNGVLFEDSQFDPQKVDLGENTKSDRRTIKWLRPMEIANNPIFIGQNEDRFDVNQGSLGDCWFLAALANVTLNSELMQLIVPSDQCFDHDYAGIFHFRFWQYGRWIDIVIDDRLPTRNGNLIYVKAKDSNVFWTSLLEKAYAKLYRSYANIEGGLVSEALEDLTGGLSESYFELLKNNEMFNFFDMMQISHVKRSFMGCAIIAQNEGEIEKEREDGLYVGHAYSITDVVQENSKIAELQKLLRIRNPWGQGEWNGDWSDNSKMWDILDEDAREELLSRREDGEFWMQFEQFVRIYNVLEFCHTNLDLYKRSQDAMNYWKSFALDGAWIAHVSLGGLPDDKNFLKNPQYILMLNDEDRSGVHRLVIGLMQKNRRIQQKPELEIGFAIFLLEELPEKKQLGQNALKNRIFTSRVQCVKQITEHLDLKHGVYCIIPFAVNSGSSCEFLLRIYSSVDISFVENDEEIKLIELETVSAGDSIDSSSSNDAIQELYKSLANEKSEQISWKELHSILLTTDADFSPEICRSMVALVDSDRTGTLNIHEFFHLWEQLGFWRGIFRSYDSNNGNRISASELREALRSVNIQVNNRIINMLLMRFGNENGEMEMQGFIYCCMKLNTMIGIYKSKYNGKASLEEWLLDTIYN